ncbi:aldehyde dehydrogenase family protein [Caulobacter segnis]
MVAAVDGAIFRRPQSDQSASASRSSPLSSEADAELALDAAHRAKSAWARLAPAERAQMLGRVAGSPRAESRRPGARRDPRQRQADPGDARRRRSASDRPFPLFLAGCIRAEEGAISTIDSDTIAYHFREPLGVVGQIIPWNFPLLIGGVEDRAGARGRQLHRDQARVADVPLSLLMLAEADRGHPSAQASSTS